MSSKIEHLKSILLSRDSRFKNQDIREMIGIRNDQELLELYFRLYKEEFEKSAGFVVESDIDHQLEGQKYYFKVRKELKKLERLQYNKSIFMKNYDLVDKLESRINIFFKENIKSVKKYHKTNEKTDNKITVSEQTNFVNENIEKEDKIISKTNLVNKEGFAVKIEELIISDRRDDNFNLEILEETKNIGQIINYLIFDIKDIRAFKIIYQKNKQVIVDSFQNRDKFERVISKYYSLSKKKKIDEYGAIAITKIIAYIVNNKDLNLKDVDKFKLVNVINDYSNQVENSKYSKHEKTRLKELLEILSEGIINENVKKLNESNSSEILRNINKKYLMENNFSKKALAEIKNIKEVNNQNYLDLRNKEVITVDLNKNICCEDAISFERLSNGNYLLGTYITDVYSYIHEGSVLDWEAYNRSKSIYLENKIITMFPKELIYYNLSLTPNKNRYVIANLFEYSPSFELINYDVKKAIINVSSSKSAKDINESIKKGDEIFVNGMFEKLMLLTSKLEKEYPNVMVYHNKKEKHRNMRIYQNLDFITYLSIHTNKMSAEKYNKSQYPFLYRVMIEEKGINIKRNLKTLDPLTTDILSVLSEIPKKAIYSPKNLGHAGLDFKVYAHTTTPVRNYAALENQKLINRILINKENLTDAEVYELEDRLTIISNHLNNKNDFVEEYREEYKYMQRVIDNGKVKQKTKRKDKYRNEMFY